MMAIKLAIESDLVEYNTRGESIAPDSIESIRGVGGNRIAAKGDSNPIAAGHETAKIRICEHPGCNRHGRNKGWVSGKPGGVRRYGRFCELHQRANGIAAAFTQRNTIKNKECTRCGWNKAPCDRHRIDPRKGYAEENVLILCPNCHRLEHVRLKGIGA